AAAKPAVFRIPRGAHRQDGPRLFHGQEFVRVEGGQGTHSDWGDRLLWKWPASQEHRGPASRWEYLEHPAFHARHRRACLIEGIRLTRNTRMADVRPDATLL